jgi:hypothetical protein
MASGTLCCYWEAAILEETRVFRRRINLWRIGRLRLVFGQKISIEKITAEQIIVILVCRILTDGERVCGVLLCIRTDRQQDAHDKTQHE